MKLTINIIQAFIISCFATGLIYTASIDSIAEIEQSSENNSNDDVYPIQIRDDRAKPRDTTVKPKTGPYKPNTTICYPHVGCFGNTFPFNNSGNYLPIHPDVLDTHFLLCTMKTLDEPEPISYINKYELLASSYDKRYPLKIIIHGFQNSVKSSWISKMTKALIEKEKEKLNIILVDWELGAIFPFYFNATANSRLIGRQTCLLVKMIKDVFYEGVWDKNFNVHCIGHSLGSHACAYASSECESKFDRITALDPAGPNFEGTDPIVRVDPTDASFVDVIHTNGDNLFTGSFGMSSPVGHVDFYPNGGKQQPGCPGWGSIIGGILSGSTTGISCSHARATLYFIESINSPCTFLAYPCQNEDDFLEGDCFDCANGGCSQMGYYASSKSRGAKYLITNSEDPFCAYPYTLEVAINAFSPKTAGEIKVTLIMLESNITTFVTEKWEDIIANRTYKTLFATEKDIEEVKKIIIRFEKKAKSFFFADTNAPLMIIDKIRIEVAETGEVRSECVSSLKIDDKQSVELNLNLDDCTFLNKRKRNLMKRDI